MLVSEPLQCVFIRNPKCASAAMDRALLSRPEWGFANVWDAVPGTPKIRHTTVIPAKYIDYTTVTTCRNPYARAVSTYFHITQNEKRNIGSWEGFLKRGPLMVYKTQTHYTGRSAYILRCERLQLDFEDFLAAMGIEQNGVRIGRHNTSRHRPWVEYYAAPWAERHVYHLFKCDFQALGYERLVYDLLTDWAERRKTGGQA